nr:hypothetical protein [Nocardia alba]
MSESGFRDWRHVDHDHEEAHHRRVVRRGAPELEFGKWSAAMDLRYGIDPRQRASVVDVGADVCRGHRIGLVRTRLRLFHH